MIRVGLFGGSFDPIHNGHLALACDALNELDLDKVIFIPARIQPFKQGRKVTSGEMRIKMIEAAARDCDKVVVSSYEIDRDDISYTVNTLRHFREELGPDAKIYFITGTDSFIQIDTWYLADEILKNYNFIVGSRPGYLDSELDSKIAEIEEKYGCEVRKIKNRQIDISSTELRELAAKGEDISRYVPEGAVKYINEEGLYR